MYRVNVTNLNASTIDIINTIRQNASLQYQNSVPEITTSTDIPKVGEILVGYPAFANEFVGALINRIAMVQIKSSLFNNPFAKLKKGYLEFGETVEEIFIELAKVRPFSAEKAEQRELKRTLPEIKSAFHVMNWNVQYPITIQDMDLRTAFTSADGVTNLITKITESCYKANEYDEYLLFKYLLIKGITKGVFYPVSIGDLSDMNESAIAFRGMSNQITFLSDKYNSRGVATNTPKANQYILMDSMFNARFDVEVLAGAFNMDKADFLGRLILIDDFTTFDNDRLSVIRDESSMIEEVTSTELSIMNNVKAVLVDESYFQVYDNLLMMSDTYVASGLYWNYFLNSRKTVCYSPFSNAITFVTSSATITMPNTVTLTVLSKSVSDSTTVLTVGITGTSALTGLNGEFIQTSDAVENGVAVHPYGAIIYPANSDSYTVVWVSNDTTYTNETPLESSADVGDTLTLTKEV